MLSPRAVVCTVAGLAIGPRNRTLDRRSAALRRFTGVLNGRSAGLGRFFSDLHASIAPVRGRTALLRGRSAQVRGMIGR